MKSLGMSYILNIKKRDYNYLNSNGIELIHETCFYKHYLFSIYLNRFIVIWDIKIEIHFCFEIINANKIDNDKIFDFEFKIIMNQNFYHLILKPFGFKKIFEKWLDLSLQFHI
jgi:hypothetical protein